MRIAAVSPFEVYPEDLSVEKIEEQGSIMHVKALPVSEIFERYGVRVAGQDVREFSLAPQMSQFEAHVKRQVAAISNELKVLLMPIEFDFLEPKQVLEIMNVPCLSQS